MSRLRDLVVISGFSGAGKTVAMNVFEDAGYFCVDNLPPEMIRGLADLLQHQGATVEQACVVSDPRGGDLFHPLVNILDELQVPHRVLFLQAEEQSLLTRYKETRRRHPLAPNGAVIDGVTTERALLMPIRERADFVIDTTELSPNALRRKVRAMMLTKTEPGRLAVTITSFGFKYGPPRDADLALDVRFLSNPHYDLELRPLTGFDQLVVDYVAADGRLQEFYDHLLPLLDYLLPQYIAEGKAHLVLAIGCTGGRHRSVAIAERLAGHLRDRPDCFVEVSHRDVDR